MSAIQKILPHYTYDDWVHWEGKWELIDGFPIAMSPAPIPEHQRVAAALGAGLSIILKNCSECKVYHPIDYVLAKDIIFVPDILVVCGKIEKKFLDFPPVLVTEILSPSTALRDRHTKFSYYQQDGVKYYLIIDIVSRQVEVYLLSNGSYERQQLDAQNGFHFNFNEECGGYVDFKELW
jgi:Uma2 family endonuclease